MPQLEAAFGAWPMAPPAPRTAVPPAPQLTAGQVTIVDMPSAEQSQIRIGWVGVPRSAPDYFPLRRAQHGPGRLVHVAPQPEPARRARLLLRRQLAVRHAAVRGRVPGGRRRADRQDRGRAARILQGAQGHRGPRERGRARQGQELRRAQLPQRIRDHQRPRGPPRGDGRLQAARHLLLAIRRQRSGGDSGGGAEGGRYLHSAGEVRGGRRRRPQSDRGGRESAQRWRRCERCPWRRRCREHHGGIAASCSGTPITSARSGGRGSRPTLRAWRCRFRPAPAFRRSGACSITSFWSSAATCRAWKAPRRRTRPASRLAM